MSLLGQAIIIPPLQTIQLQMSLVCKKWGIPYINLADARNPDEITKKIEELNQKLFFVRLKMLVMRLFRGGCRGWTWRTWRWTSVRSWTLSAVGARFGRTALLPGNSFEHHSSVPFSYSELPWRNSAFRGF